jgi:hypothetical protein
MDSLVIIPGVGKSISKNLQDIGIKEVDDLKNRDPEELYQLSNKQVGFIQDRCLLYTFRCAIYFAEGGRDQEKLRWWNWKDEKN